MFSSNYIHLSNVIHEISTTSFQHVIPMIFPLQKKVTPNYVRLFINPRNTTVVGKNHIEVMLTNFAILNGGPHCTQYIIQKHGLIKHDKTVIPNIIPIDPAIPS